MTATVTPTTPFVLSADAAKSRYANRMPIEHKAHPVGANGAKTSLLEVAKKIREGHKDVDLRAWAGKIIMAAGRPKSIHDQVQVLLDAFRKQTMYVQDPVNAELIVAPRYTLCLEPNGLCMPIRDCDDGTVALGAAVASCGIPVKVVAQAFDGVPIPTHVLFAAETERGWERVEPSSDDMKVGECHKATNEWEFDPFSPETLRMLNAPPGGDFVGVGKLARLGDVQGDAGEFAKRVLSDAYVELQTAVSKMRIWIDQVQTTRRVLRPDHPYDPEPQNFTIKSVADFPTNGMWTRSMFEIAVKVWATGEWMLGVLRDGANGSRDIFVAQKTNEVAVGKSQSDAHSFAGILEGVGEKIVGVFDHAGQLVGGFTSKGRELSDGEVATLRAGLQKPNTTSGLGWAQVVLVGILVVGAIAVNVAAVLAIKAICDMITQTAYEATQQAILQCASDPKCNEVKAKNLLEADAEARRKAAEAKNEANKNDPFNKAMDTIAKTITWVAVGGIVAAGIYFGAPLIKGAVEKMRKKQETSGGARESEKEFLIMVYGRWGSEPYAFAGSRQEAETEAMHASKKYPDDEFCVELEPGDFDSPCFKAGRRLR